jgi:hypothetical protein
MEEMQRCIRGGGVRRKGSTFWAPALSHTGKMSSDIFQLIKWITAISRMPSGKGAPCTTALAEQRAEQSSSKISKEL